jgi:hypothetical protein
VRRFINQKNCTDLHVAKKKHQVATLEELIEVQSNLENSGFRIRKYRGGNS